ncbi:uncharacterized protein BP01DRAFT_306601 [Aspergillus saccharolyticus JOP 1030-1]|uniref:Btz domain-containing protein n=1 Tax=Aspergillus saccharolyticus JOP 1030-1 TaxID=1450539 RepID=A0A318Z8L4_9EURO|nr:hypothetical protein BP01DRAFT_306601 [Aspergillus saccharolyticus JOP 1030-1]PYH41113.1 hypothetical protein BP01DRAFT_306601 [Aspergillus saccharolyticus JOP 1030-1]
MAPRRHNIGASRRRRKDEEGEDEGSLDGELEDDSLSEGSVISHQDDDDADGEGSDESDDGLPTPLHHPHASQPSRRKLRVHQKRGRRHSSSPGKRLVAGTMSDTEAMMNGMKLSEDNTREAEIHFDDLRGELDPSTGRTPSAPPSEPRRETVTEKKRREQEKFIAKDKDENSAVMPTRGSFFLHEKRSGDTVTNGHKTSMKSKTRPYGLIVDGNVRRHNIKPDASEGQWAHDLHDTVAQDHSSTTVKAPTVTTGFSNYPQRPVPTAPRSSPPNRSFSSTTLIGNVPVVVLLPGMEQPISYPAVTKRQHTRLPQHRPPLRRDKPVRISLPGQPPRYIFPAIERSFIFIPRALRPNQQAFRGRRGGFMTGRRPSIYASSAYAPSVSISRRSSLGKPPSQEGWHSPAGSVFSRHTIITAENGKPVVRLPPPRPPLGIPHVPAGPVVAPSAVPPPLPSLPLPPAYRESRPAPIPMHQPRPQKAVSVADIETPASFPFNTPQPQQEQPFHHQVPMPANGPVYGPEASTHAAAVQASATPVSHIPDRAIHAQPFQPYGFQQPQVFYPASYQATAVYYPNSGAEYATFNAANGSGAPALPFPQGQHGPPYMVPPAPASGEQASQPGMVAHEAGGTVYFYDANQMYSNSAYGVPSAPGPGGVVGMGGMLTPPGATYYYPQSQSGVYYASQ